jgi:1-acyl-sn-glycerol-3-phosphate acyltransferase
MRRRETIRRPVETYAQAKSRTGLALLVGLADRLFGDRLFFLLGCLLAHLTIEGEDHIPAIGPCLIPMNHVALVADALVCFTIRRRRPDVHLFGWQTLSGENPIYRFLDSFGGLDDETRLLRAYKARGLSAGELLRARQVLLQGGAIVLPAEGEITWDGRLQHPLAPGTAWLALRTGAPVVPVVSIGGYDLQPRWQLEKIRLTGRVTIRVGQPFTLFEAPITRLTDEILNAANQRLWEAMAALLQPHW